MGRTSRDHLKCTNNRHDPTVTLYKHDYKQLHVEESTSWSPFCKKFRQRCLRKWQVWWVMPPTGWGSDWLRSSQQNQQRARHGARRA